MSFTFSILKGVLELLGHLDHGFSESGSNIFTISVFPFWAALWIGVNPLGSGSLGLSQSGANIFTMSVFPYWTALWIGVNPLGSGSLELSQSGANIFTISAFPLQPYLLLLSITYLSLKSQFIFTVIR